MLCETKIDNRSNGEQILTIRDPNTGMETVIVMPGLGDDKLAGHKGFIAFVQSPKVCVVAIASGYNA